MSARKVAKLCVFGLLLGCSAPSSNGIEGSSSGPGGSAGGAAEPVPRACRDVLGAEDCKALAAIELPSALPPAAGNAHAESFEAALFGFHVFFDARFSKNQQVRCESCHSVDYEFGDNEPTPKAGLGPGTRNAPTLVNAARYTTFLWDGQADSLWSQPLFAFENPKEMGFTRLEIVHLLDTLYAKEYAGAFGPLPDVTDPEQFPAAGAPGDASFDGMTADNQTVVNGIVANLGKALEAYMRKIATGPSAVDQHLAGDPDALTAQQVEGMYAFAKYGCLACHSGPALSDNRFHAIGVAAAPGQEPDAGRLSALSILQANPFNSSGPFFDGQATGEHDLSPVLGGFRTPSLRNLPRSGPYGHNGTFATLRDIVDFHLQGGGRGKDGFVGTVDPLLEEHSISAAERDALLEFLKVLAGKYPPLPWGQWPNGNG